MGADPRVVQAESWAVLESLSPSSPHPAWNQVTFVSRKFDFGAGFLKDDWKEKRTIWSDMMPVAFPHSMPKAVWG